MKKHYFPFLIILVSFLIFPLIVLAQPTGQSNPALNDLDNVGTVYGPYQKPGGDTQTQLLTIVGTVVGIGLGILGVAFLGLMLYAGYNWMTAQGDEEKVTRAKDTITRAIIGIIIIVGSYAAWVFLFKRLF